jgi:hypothetical protein
LRKAIDPNEEDRLKFEALDVLYVGHVDKRIDQVITVNEDGNRWQPPDGLFYLINTRGEPLSNVRPRKMLRKKGPRVRFFGLGRRFGPLGVLIEKSCQGIRKVAQLLALPIADVDVPNVDPDAGCAVQPLNFPSFRRPVAVTRWRRSPHANQERRSGLESSIVQAS